MSSSSYVIPGQQIIVDKGFLKGHGTYTDDSNDFENNGPNLFACVPGQIERVNKLVTVKPIKCRYIGAIGDLIVGRITSIENKRWKVDYRGWRVS